MTLPTMWIRQNMLQSPGPSRSNNARRIPTEAEIKVQRSLKKLSIPEWYLNNNARPPKLLLNDTPIESRPPQWKEQPLNKSVAGSTPVMPAQNLTVNRNGLLETEIGPALNQSYGTYKINRSSPTEKSPLGKKVIASSQTNQVAEKELSRPRLPNISGTFPRVSPSRKIQNINIVFPQPQKLSLSHTITDIDSDDSHMDMTKDSLEEIASPKIVKEDLETSGLADSSVMSNSSEAKVSRMPNQQLTYIKPWKSPVPCVTPDGKSSNGHNLKILASSTPQESSISLISDSAIDESSLKEKKTSAISLFPASEAPKITRKPPMVPQRAVKPIVPEKEEICDACKADVARRNSPSARTRPFNGFRKSDLCTIDEHGPSTPRQRLAASPTAADSPTVAFFTSKKKSSQLENIIKRKDPQRGGKSLVQEIIEVLNEKCRISAQPTYVTPGSKNFVKKLVRALEKGTLPKKVEEEPLSDYPEVEEDDVEVVSSGNGSEDDVKSAAASTSISYKGSDSNSSSDSELRSPTLKQNYNYDWNMNIRKNINETVTSPNSETKILNKNEDEVYWIPVSKSKLPRTSSLISMIFFEKSSSDSIARVALDMRLGCMDDDADLETQQLIDAVHTFFTNVGVLELKIPFWKIFKTPTWRQYVTALDTILNFTSKYTKIAMARAQTGSSENQMKELSLLERVLKLDDNENEKMATILALDLSLVGIDTTANAVASVLYHLACHPEKQAILHEEIKRELPVKDMELERKHLDNLKYLKACIKETMRMRPVVIGNGRCTTKDTTIGGYQVPTGVQVIFQHYVISNQEKYFPRCDEFLPERWLRESGVQHAFASLPFGYGRRMCLGRRFADLEMIIVLSKIMQSFRLEYCYEKLDYHINPLYTPKGPLKLKFIKK